MTVNTDLDRAAAAAAASQFAASIGCFEFLEFPGFTTAKAEPKNKWVPFELRDICPVDRASPLSAERTGHLVRHHPRPPADPFLPPSPVNSIWTDEENDFPTFRRVAAALLTVRLVSLILNHFLCAPFVVH